MIVAVTICSRYGHSLLEEARRDNQKLLVVIVVFITNIVVDCREEMLLELKNELAAMQAKLELQQQEVRLCIV